MGNHQDSARELAQRLIQCLLGVQIQMVGGLVQDQHIGLAQHHNGKLELGPLTAGQRPHLLIDILAGEQYIAQHGADCHLIEPGIAVPQLIQSGLFIVKAGVLLLIVGEIDILSPVHLALVNGEQSLDGFEQ